MHVGYFFQFNQFLTAIYWPGNRLIKPPLQSDATMKVTERWLRMSGASLRSTHGNYGVVDLKHYNARFAEWGSGPPLVLVPGLAGGIELIEPLAQVLAQHFHVFTYDLRGEDDCFALRRRCSLDDLADDLSEIVTWRGLERPVIAGVSFGGVVALTSAARHPSQFAALAVQGVGARLESGLIQRIAAMVLANYPLPEDCPFVNQFFNLLFGGKPRPEHFTHAIQTCWQTDQSVMSHRLRLIRRFDMQALLPRISIPTLVVSGSKDVLVSGRNAMALVNALPDCHQAQIHRAGHLAPVSHARETAGAMHSFFSGLSV